MQLMPVTARRLGVRDSCNIESEHLRRCALSGLVDATVSQRSALVAAGYYAGEDIVARRDLFYHNHDVVSYVARIRATYVFEAKSLSLLYLNPPYDLEVGRTNNQRLELVFLEHTYRWLKPGGVLVFVIPQPQLKPCARILSEHFTGLIVFLLTEPACVQYKQVAVVGIRRKRQAVSR